MKHRLPALAVALVALATLPAPAPAQYGEIASYTARLSTSDHFNSSGQRLRTAAGIIRQDRANFFKFGSGDPEDEADPFFASAANRNRLEIMLARGRISNAVNSAIVNGTPVIRVRIFSGYVLVTVY